MAQLVEDIKKGGEGPDKNGREIVLSYLDEFDKAAKEKTNQPEEKKPVKKIIDSLTVKNVTFYKKPPIVPKDQEPKVDFVQQFKDLNRGLFKAGSEMNSKPKPSDQLQKGVVPETISKSEAQRPPELKPDLPVRQASPVSMPKKIDKPIEGKELKFKSVGIWEGFKRRLSGKDKKPLEVKQVLKKNADPLPPTKKESKRPKRQEAMPQAGKFLIWSIRSVVGLVGLFLVYVMFCLSLYTFSIDNSVARLIARYLPVPAIITDFGTINFYDYLDAKDTAFKQVARTRTAEASGQLAGEMARQELVRNRIVLDLAQGYALIGQGDVAKFNFKTIEEKLKLAVVKDVKYNRFAISKVEKIKKELTAGKDFDETLSSLDLVANVEYFTSETMKKRFGKQSSGLIEQGKPEIIITPSGYYVVKNDGNLQGLIGLKYVFIKAVTLDEVLMKELRLAKVIILVN